MSKFLRKAWPFLVIWGLMGLYFFAAPGIYDRFFVREGKPVQENVTLLAKTNESQSGLDAFVLYDQQNGVYQVLGWAFLTVDKNIPAGNYERQVVLASSKGNYVFSAQTTRRVDVQKYFSNLGMNVNMSGFSTLINRNVVKRGTYGIGMILKDTASGTTYYIDTGRCVTRTPNDLVMENVMENPGISCQSSAAGGTGQPVQMNVKLPGEVSQAQSGVDALVKSSGQDGVYQFWGWGFPTVDKSIPASDYERQVVLVTSKGNYVFAADAAERTDVQKVFSDLGMDVTMSGVSAFINSNSLDPGVYGIGLIFKNTASGTTYYIDTGRCVNRTSNSLVLGDPGNSTCQSSADTGQPVQVNVKLPVEIIQAQSGVDSLVKSSAQVGVYQLWGWGFPTIDKSIPASGYERQVVLVTSKGNYVFKADAAERTDVQKYFSGLGMDVTMSGVSAFINGNALKPGVYGIGLIFKNTASGTTYYIDTGRCVNRTSNNLVLEDPGNSACKSSASGDIGQPVQVNVKLPVEVSQAQSGLEALVKSSTQGGVYQLWGWAFPTVDKSIPAGDYERQVVLVTSKGNYVYAAEPVERTDVQKYFSGLGMDVTMSGVSAFINSNSLDPGVYGIGLIFKNTSSGATSYINAGRCLQRTANELSLEDPGSSICQSP